MFAHPSHTPSRLDARTRLAAILVPALLVGATLNPLSLIILTSVALGLGLLVRLTLADLRRAWLPVLIFCLVTLFLHLMFVHPKGGSSIDLEVLAISEQGLQTGLLYCWRIVLFAVFALCFVRWITQEEFVESVWRLILPLGKLGVSAQGIGMALTIAIRFIPQIFAEHRRIEMAQRARGAQRGGSLPAKTRQALPLIVPTVASALRRIGTTGDALTVRCWGLYPTRTFLRQSSPAVADIVILTGLIMVVIVLALI